MIDNLINLRTGRRRKAAAIHWANKFLVRLETLDKETRGVLNSHIFKIVRRHMALAAVVRQLNGLFSIAVYPEVGSGAWKMDQLRRDQLSRGEFAPLEPKEFELQDTAAAAPAESDSDSAASNAMRDRFRTFRQSGALEVIDIFSKLDICKLVMFVSRAAAQQAAQNGRAFPPKSGRWPDPALTALVVTLTPIWCRVTREEKTKLCTTDAPDKKGVPNSKTSRFARWLAKLISDAVGTVSHEQVMLGGDAAREALVYAAARAKHPEWVGYYNDLLDRRDVLRGWLDEQGAHYGTAAVKHLDDVSKNLADAASDAEAVLKACLTADIKKITNIIRNLRPDKNKNSRPDDVISIQP